MIARTLVGTALLLLLQTQAHAQQPLEGKWQLDAAKTKAESLTGSFAGVTIVSSFTIALIDKVSASRTHTTKEGKTVSEKLPLESGRADKAVVKLPDVTQTYTLEGEWLVLTTQKAKDAPIKLFYKKG